MPENGKEISLKAEKTDISDKQPDKNSKIFIIFALVVGLVSVLLYFDYREDKKNSEIERIKQRPEKEKYSNPNSCEAYSLRARTRGDFPCYNCGIKTTIYLKEGEVWKYGKTCIGEEKRYYNLEELNLQFYVEYKGTEKECLIREKELIYSYPLVPECRIREIKLIRPPGNKIDR